MGGGLAKTKTVPVLDLKLRGRRMHLLSYILCLLMARLALLILPLH